MAHGLGAQHRLCVVGRDLFTQKPGGGREWKQREPSSFKKVAFACGLKRWAIIIKIYRLAITIATSKHQWERDALLLSREEGSPGASSLHPAVPNQTQEKAEAGWDLRKGSWVKMGRKEQLQPPSCCLSPGGEGLMADCKQKKTSDLCSDSKHCCLWLPPVMLRTTDQSVLRCPASVLLQNRQCTIALAVCLLGRCAPSLLLGWQLGAGVLFCG